MQPGNLHCLRSATADSLVGMCQALEVATWGALLKAPRAVLAGDHLQLPPTIISDQAAAQVRAGHHCLAALRCCSAVLLYLWGCSMSAMSHGCYSGHVKASAMPSI